MKIQIFHSCYSIMAMWSIICFFLCTELSNGFSTLHYYNNNNIRNPSSLSVSVSNIEGSEDNIVKGAHFFSKKNLSEFIKLASDAKNTSKQGKGSDKKNSFKKLCEGANISRPSRIQSLSWPALLDSDKKHTIIADQTGSGKTLAYLLPLLHNLILDKQRGEVKSNSDNNTDTNGSPATPKILVLAPTVELATQVRNVCASLSNNLPPQSSFRTVLVTSKPTSSKENNNDNNIRDQIRMLTMSSSRKDIEVIVGTPGRIASLLRSKAIDLSLLQSLVLDEIDILLLDETFGPQLRQVGMRAPQQTQFVFVTATLPDSVLNKVKEEFGGGDIKKNLAIVKGPGLHRIAPTVTEELVDVSVPSTSNRNKSECLTKKIEELLIALRKHRTSQTLVFCNTVETCRKVENFLKRQDRRGKIYAVQSYHNAMTPTARNAALKSFSTAASASLDDNRRVMRRTRGEGGYQSNVLICTDRAARGVDFEGTPVDHVVIFDFPKDPAEYVRRVGRTARAGRSGHCTVMAYGWQLPIARKIMGKKNRVESGEGFVVDFDDEDEDDIYIDPRRNTKRHEKAVEMSRKMNGKKKRNKNRNSDAQELKGVIEGGKMWKEPGGSKSDY